MAQKQFQMLFELKARTDGTFKGTFKDAAKNMTTLRSEMTSLDRVTKQMSGVKKNTEALQRNKDEAAKLSRECQTLQKEISETEKPSRALTNELEKKQKKLAEVNQRTKEYEKRLSGLKGELKEAGINTEKLSEENKRLTETYDKLKGHAKTLNAITEAQERNKQAISETKAELLKYTAVAAAAGTAAYKLFVKPAADFQEQMSTVQALSGASAKEMELLKEKAISTASTSKFMSKEAGQAMEYMALAGWKTNEMLSGLDGIINLAAASNEDLGTVSDIVTDALTAFGLSARDSAHFADVLAAASANSNTNVAMLGEAFKYAAPLAGAFGFTVEDTSLALGLMANAGIKASQGGTSLRKIFAQLSTDFKIAQRDGSTTTIKVTELDGSMRSLRDIVDDVRTAFNGMSAAEKAAADTSLADAARELGIELADADGALKSTADLYNEVAEAVDGLTEAGKVQQAENIAGKTAMAGLLSIVNAAEDDYLKLADAIEHCDGAAKQMADTRLDNYNGQIILLKSAWEGLSITVGNEFLPVLTDAAKSLTETAVRAGEWAKKNGGTIRTIAKVTAGLAALKIGSLLLKLAALQAEKGILKFAKAITKVKAGVDIMTSGKGLPGLISSLTGIASKLTVFTSGAVLAAAAAAALGVVLYKLWQNAKKADLASRFGDITLSMEELDQAAAKIVSSKNMDRAAAALERFDRMSEISESIREAKDSLQMLDWQVGIGLKLTAEEKESYQAAASAYQEKLQSYIKEQGFGLTIGAAALFDDKSVDYQQISTSVQNVTAAMTEHLDGLGTALGGHLSKAFSNEIFRINEYKAAADILAKMAEIERLVAEAQTTAKMEMLQLEYGAALTPESYAELQAKLNEAAAEGAESIKAAIEQELAGLHSQVLQAEYLLNNAETESEVEKYKSLLAEAETARDSFVSEMESGKFSELTMEPLIQASEFALETLGQAYPELSDIVNMSEQEIADALESMDVVTRTTVKECISHIDDNIAKVDEQIQIYQLAGREIPKEIQKIKNAYDNISALPVPPAVSVTRFGGAVQANAAGSAHTQGTFIAGEKGPELITNAPGMTVYNAMETARALRGFKRSEVIPGFAGGTSRTPDTFVAGERGPELITNAPGRTVYTASQTRQIFSGSNEQKIHIESRPTIQVYGESENTAQQIEQKLKEHEERLVKRVRDELRNEQEDERRRRLA